MIDAKQPSTSYLKQFFPQTLLDSPSYKIDIHNVPIKLDQNESPFDWPPELKQKVLDAVKDRPWNRYPAPFGDDLDAKIASYAGVKPSCVLTGPGSNYLLALMINSIGHSLRGEMVIARPSFALYEAHCHYEGIPYRTWELDDDLEYDPNTLSDLKPGSCVFFASPNNPVGNVLPKETFRSLLEQHPESLFIADEAYVEFADEPYTDLLNSFDNVIIVRTFSKTMGAAGLRIGYLLGAESTLALLKRHRLPYLINHFGMAAGLAALTDPTIQAFREKSVSNAKEERDSLYKQLLPLCDDAFKVKQPFANFLLLRWHDDKEAQRVYQGLIERGILVRNVSKGPGLSGCLRVTVGLPKENKALLEALRDLI